MKKAFKTILLLFSLAAIPGLLAGCPPKSPVFPKVVETNSPILNKCTYLGELHSSNREGEPHSFNTEAESVGIQTHDAYTEVMQNAAEIGATNIVWSGDTYGYGSHMSARAYRCEK